MNREEALDVALGQIERQFGKGSVMRLGEKPVVEIEAISTGSLSLDIALGKPEPAYRIEPDPAAEALLRRHQPS